VSLACRLSDFTKPWFARPNVAHYELGVVNSIGRFQIATASFRGTPSTLDLSPLRFTPTAQEGRVCSNQPTAHPDFLSAPSQTVFVVL
jgi:hypothetical protein